MHLLLPLSLQIQHCLVHTFLRRYHTPTYAVLMYTE